jgi:hypothetical protein
MPNACSPYALTGPMGRGTITGPSKNSSKPLSFEAAISFNCTPFGNQYGQHFHSMLMCAGSAEIGILACHFELDARGSGNQLLRGKDPLGPSTAWCY